MKNLIRLLVAGCAMGLLVGPASAQLPSRPFLTGTWEGVMTIVAPQGDGSTTAAPPLPADLGQLGYRLEIAQTNLVMYFQTQDGWVSFGEGQDLRLNQQGRSSIVVSALPGPTENTIETMLLNIVRWDEDTIMVHMSRLTGPDEEAGQGPGAVNFMGRLEKTSG